MFDRSSGATSGLRLCGQPLGTFASLRASLIVGLFGVIMMAVIPMVAAAQDSDLDGIADDGDGSGSAFDAPCMNLQVSACDDNCRLVANPTQADSNGDLIGDACQDFPPPALQTFNLSTGQETEPSNYRWKEGPPAFLTASESLAAAPLELADGSQCFFSDVSPSEVTVGYLVPATTPPFGGAICCTWQADCNFLCLTEGDSQNDCSDLGTCPAFPEFRDCILAIKPDWDGEEASLTISERNAIGAAARDPNSVCAGLSDGVGGFFPLAACCFQQTTTAAIFWGHDQSIPTDPDGDRHPTGCDNCPTVPNRSQLDADGDGRGAECDSYDNSIYVCADTDADGCNDCSYGSFDPFNDGVDPDGTLICAPEPVGLSMIIIGWGTLIVMGRHRRAFRVRASLGREFHG